MSRINQRTLFQTWGTGVPETAPAVKKVSHRRTVGTTQAQGKRKDRVTENGHHGSHRSSLWAEVCPPVTKSNEAPEEEPELDDDLMLQAVHETEKSIELLENSTGTETEELVADSTTDLPGYDSSSGRVWIYPTNFPIRDYQLKISEAALVQNTLVCLPTGLGKTFIASVVMYNLYRWYPSGKIVFMAPTKPLVAQQIEACYKVMGIPQQHMAELTGSTPAPQRRELWRSKRVFFLTPQVMVNDLSRNVCPGPQVKCVVIDEAHKALGNHAYCQVVRELGNQTKQFRVLALSATPGGDIKAVQQVVSNLLISHIELRSEESPDVQAHCHQRSLEKIVVPLGESLTEYQTRYLQVLEKFTFRLTQMRVINHHDLRTLTKYQLILAREQFRRNPPPHVMVAQRGVFEGDFALCISLYHGYELLQQMGLRSLFLFLQNIMQGSKESSRARKELQSSTIFMTLYKDMEALFLTCAKGPAEQYFYSHPKLHKLDEVVLQHFQEWSKNSGSGQRSGDTSAVVSTRVMIFSSFRESVQEIAEMLNRHQPLIRVMTFMGQASAQKGVKGFTQKEQLEVMRRFREGCFNTLVSTCVGEEGLDIGEVDLIICFDAQKSPIRLVQRMGRTGRHRQGRIVIILAEGREERTYNQSQSNRRSVNKCIVGNKHSLHMFPHSPRMVPVGVTPTLHKMHITCGQFEPKNTSRRSIKDNQSLPRERLLLNPQAQVGAEQDSVKDDGFLSPAEQAEWASTMKLPEDEPQFKLRESSFLFLGGDPQLHESSVHSEVRHLSLWEWRHWQNQPLPTHRVEHSSRCLHFTAIMDLTDRMKLEEEVDFRYESDLVSYQSKEDVADCTEDGRAPAQTSGKTPCQSKSKANCVGRDTGLPISTANSGGLSAFQSICNNSGTDEDVVYVLSDDETKESNINTSPQEDTLQRNPTDPECAVTETNPDLHCDLQEEFLEYLGSTEEMFYLPKWNDCPKPHPVKKHAESLNIILSNVRNFLSKSPEKHFDLEPAFFNELKNISSHIREEADQFQVSFSLERDQNSVAEDSDNSDITNILHESPDTPDIHLPCERLPDNRLSTGPVNTSKSPSWDVLFDDGLDDREADKKADELPLQSNMHLQFTSLDESVDLFGDDEAFLQVSLSETKPPNKTSVTPEKDIQPKEQTTPGVEHISDASSRSNSLQFGKEAASPPDSEALACSQGNFSVNFDLGFSFDSDEEPAEQTPAINTRTVAEKEQTFSSPTPNPSKHRYTAGHVSTPRVFSKNRKTVSSLMENTNMSPITTDRNSFALKTNASILSSAFVSPEPKNIDISNKTFSPQIQFTGNRSSRQSPFQFRKTAHQSACSGHLNSDSEEEVIVKKKGGPVKINALASPEAKIICSDVESPIQICRKRVPQLNKKAKHKAGRQFLDEEAELSEDGDTVSSDECDGEELDQSLQGFVVDTTQLSQGLNDSEMQGFYLKSVRSPAVTNKYRMVHKPLHNMDIFSQIPEQDETYAEDSFVVSGSEVEEVGNSDEEEEEDVVLIGQEDSYVDGRRMYATRRRVQVRQTSTEVKNHNTEKPQKTKRSRIVRVVDSSDDEEESTTTKMKRLCTLEAPVSEKTAKQESKTSPGVEGCTKQTTQHKDERTQQKFRNKALLSEKLDFREPLSTSLAKNQSSVATGSKAFGSSSVQASSRTRLSILVDSRCIVSGADVVSALRFKHGVVVEVCSLMTCDFIVSKRMAVEWQSESEVASPQSRKRLQQRIQSLQALFERVCFIVEKDRTKTGEPLRFFQRTSYYDSTVAGLVRAGIRLLVSQGPEDTAALLAELAQAELRKEQAISVPLEVKGPQQQALKFYLTLPCVTYVNALYMCHGFSSVSHLVNSSVDALQAGACLSHSKAAEIYHCLHYPCDPTLMKINTPTKNL
ncbi:Fanconi anemia group M protein isoform X1 [Astyanax mexicanus]|uniref:FA complementation group M n=1 Tax=Astyanax mexicanus TaxID=7994 RepID=A0A8B9RLY4_ASTMX|nr:Fanconi anemia group M protein isoform X1 [Astyanax mexicanus]